MDPTSSPPAASMPSRAASERSDEELLQAAGAEPEAFAMFYRRHVRALSAYFWRRSRDAETTADLTAETFAAALDGCAFALSAPRTSRPPRSSSGSGPTAAGPDRRDLCRGVAVGTQAAPATAPRT